jgi:hypothetical protein
VINHRIAAAAALVAVSAVFGCASVGDRADAAAAVAVRLLQAVDAHDGAAACAVLAPGTADEVQQSASKPCDQAILDDDLPKPGTVVDSAVFGQRAQVRLADDTVFLAMFPGGWRVVAAGCTARGDRPYDCLVQGD